MQANNSECVTLHAERGLMDFTENREFFSRSRCVNFNFHARKFIFHSWRETNHAAKLRVKFHAMKLGVKIIFTA